MTIVAQKGASPAVERLPCSVRLLQKDGALESLEDRRIKSAFPVERFEVTLKASARLDVASCGRVRRGRLSELRRERTPVVPAFGEPAAKCLAEREHGGTELD
jgi:hypothetical protein